jgi:hypothetical protein
MLLQSWRRCGPVQSPRNRDLNSRLKYHFMHKRRRFVTYSLVLVLVLGGLSLCYYLYPTTIEHLRDRASECTQMRVHFRGYKGKSQDDLFIFDQSNIAHVMAALKIHGRLKRMPLEISFGSGVSIELECETRDQRIPLQFTLIGDDLLVGQLDGWYYWASLSDPKVIDVLLSESEREGIVKEKY